MRKTLAMLTILLLLTGSITGCTPRTVTRSTAILDTVASFTLYNSENISIINQTIQVCKDYEKLLSKTVTGSDVSKLNAAQGLPLKTDSRTFSLLRQAVDYAQLSGGLFDITIQPVVALWDFKSDNSATPDAKALAKAVARVDYHNIVFNDNSSVSLQGGAQIDLGGIAKGYIADRAAEFIRQSGIKSAVVDLGGNVVVIGRKSDNELFKIGIRKPFDKLGGTIGTVQVLDKAVVTSGVYERYFELGSKRYWHILDPNTGYPAETDLLSATIIGDDATRCDAISTICILLGLDEAMELVRKQGLDAVFITREYRIITTPGFTAKYSPTFESDYQEYVD